MPPSDGREQAGRRPAVVVQKASEGADSPLVIVVPLSSKIGSARFPATVVVEPDEANGLSFRSVALGFQLRGVDRVRFRSRLGEVSESDFAEIKTALRSLMSF